MLVLQRAQRAFASNSDEITFSHFAVGVWISDGGGLLDTVCRQTIDTFERENPENGGK